MSGTTSASIVPREALQPVGLCVERVGERELERVQELERALAHDDEELRLHDVQLAGEPCAGASRAPARRT